MSCHVLAVSFALVLAGVSPLLAQQTNVPGPAVKPAAKLVEPTEAKKLIDGKKVVILDVRSPAEYANGHLHGSTNIDIRDPQFQARIDKLDKNQTYLVHCAVGMRSARACEAMDKLEFKNLYDLKGGLTAWEKAGLPLEK